MTKKEFLKQLKAALDNNISQAVVSENLDYYGSYIDGEIQSGRREQEVIAGLGDPWAIARTIIETEKRNGGASYTYTVQDDVIKRESNNGTGFKGMSPDVKHILTIVLVVVVIFAVISAVMGLIVSLLPIIIPIVLVLAVINVFQRKN